MSQVVLSSSHFGHYLSTPFIFLWMVGEFEENREGGVELNSDFVTFREAAADENE
jgi:hypothetical protein